MATITIKDPADPRIAAYSSIREKDLTGRGDRFIVEGKVTLDILVRRSRFEIESVFIAEHRLAAIAESLAALGDRAPVYTAPGEVFDAIAGFPVHRGILACARKGAPASLGSMARSDRLVVAMGLSNHDNVGALFRNAAAFGADGVILDGESCDPLYRKSIRVSAGGALWLPFVHGPAAGEIMGALAASGHALWALTPRPAAGNLWDRQPPARLALVVGAEGPGLPDDIIDAATPVRIPMAGDFDSVNVATAAAIALARVFSSRFG